MVQGVFSIPLSAHVAAPAATSGLRQRTARPTVLNEFIAGPENRLAAIAVRSVLDDDADRVSPLVLYGPGGSGKSHIARGLGDWWQRHHPTAHVVILSGADFAQQYADALEHDRLYAWRSKLRSAEMFVLDDLGGLTGKRGAQQELRFVLDELLNTGSLIVVASRSLPTTLTDLADNLRSRLAGGLSVPLNLPSPATRRAILDRYATARGVSLSPKAMQTLADHLNVPAPVLLGALMELELAARTDGKPIDVERIRNYVSQHGREKPLTIREIATAVAKYFNLKLTDLKSPSRRKAIVTARNLAVVLTRHLTNQSLTEIGEYFGGRDHTTILHGYQKTDKLLKTDPAIRQALTELKRIIALSG